MVALTDMYSLRGYYIFNGVKGYQEGSVRIYRDGRVLGEINDDNKDGIIKPGAKKLFLGYTFDNAKKLRFFKVPIFEDNLNAIFWDMEKEKKEGNKLYYSGIWGIVQDVVDMAVLFSTTAKGVEEGISALEKVPISVLRRIFEKNANLERILETSRTLERTGKIILSRD